MEEVQAGGKEGEGRLSGSGKQDVPAGSSGGRKAFCFVLFFLFLHQPFPKYHIVSCLPPVPNRPLESHKTRLVIAWVNSSLMAAAQVEAA